MGGGGGAPFDFELFLSNRKRTLTHSVPNVMQSNPCAATMKETKHDTYRVSEDW